MKPSVSNWAVKTIISSAMSANWLVLLGKEFFAHFCPSSWQCVGNVLGRTNRDPSHFSRKPAFGQMLRLLPGGSDAYFNRFSARFHGCKSMSQWTHELEQC
jgi:hypothetical protein